MKQVFGIRHHGPGTARSVRHALETMQPDLVLIEGPPDADGVIPLAADAEMEPPVALLVYRPDQPRRAVYYPFAVFSPEWQAIRFALEQKVEVHFMDLPQMYQLVDEPKRVAATDGDGEDSSEEEAAETLEFLPEDRPEDTDEAHASSRSEDPAAVARTAIREDPLGHLAAVAGYSDGERWWEHMVEQRRGKPGDSRDLFAAILEAMTALRSEAGPAPPGPSTLREERREAFMRKTIRTAEKAGYQRIAIVCGAWHGPALLADVPARADDALLKGLPKAKVLSTWVPWTYGRLALASGYGAGVHSPGWYHHLFSNTDDVASRWVAGAARMLRTEGIDASSAQVVDAVRLSESLAALRHRPLPGLPELDEAMQAVLCMGRPEPMQLIEERLTVGDRIGGVPPSTPMVPLAQDVERERKRLRLKLEATEQRLALDLRKETDRGRSHLLHRLSLLGIPWGEPLRPPQRMRGGSFHEDWKLRWSPELALGLIEASAWGNTLPDAASARVESLAREAADLPSLTSLLGQVLDAELPDAIGKLMSRIEVEAALASDVAHLAGAIPPLAEPLRYGNVRRTDVGSLRHVLDGLVARTCIGLPGACASLDDNAAQSMAKRIGDVDGALRLVGDPNHLTAWGGALAKLLDGGGLHGLHGLIAGRAARLLLDAESIDSDEAERRASVALSPGTPPSQAAAWIEGFLRGSALLVLHDDRLWHVLDRWIASLSDEAFPQVLPLLRRTFATFSAPERRRIGERARRGSVVASQSSPADFDASRGDAVLPLLIKMLGLDAPPSEIDPAI